MAGAEKPVPSSAAVNNAPPNEDYVYFEESRDHPFLHGSGGFEYVNAWWLAEASLLAYADPDFAVPRFRDAGFSEVERFSDESTQCYAVQHEDFIIVAFSGSDMRNRKDTDSTSDILTDWLVNLDAGMVDSERGGRVHKGFQGALDEIWDPPGKDEDERLKSYLDGICEDGRRKVWFTGHSLGAALATLASGRYEHAPELYTFGSPRVGDRAYAESLSCHAHRFVHDRDIVCKVPLSGPYDHVGTTKYIDDEGVIHDEHEEQDESGGLLQSLTSTIGSVSAISAKLVRGMPDDYLTDHAPIFYAVHVWNNYVRS